MPGDVPKRRFFSATVRWRGFVDIALILALIGTWLGLLGRFHWTLDLFSHFRWQYFLLCLVGVALSLALKRPRWVQALCLASLLVNAVALYQLRGDPAYAATTADRLRVVSLNVYIGNPDKARMLDTLRSANADVVFLMEVDSAWAAALAPLAATYPHQLLAPRDDNFGLALLSRVPLESLELIQLSELATPSVLARMTLAGRELAILGVHPPPPINGQMAAARDTQLDATARYVSDLLVPVLVIGDLNATPWSNGLRLLRRGTTLDFRSPDPSWTPTWHAATPFAVPIDQALVTPPLVVASRNVGSDVGSDHRPQMIEVAWQ